MKAQLLEQLPQMADLIAKALAEAAQKNQPFGSIEYILREMALQMVANAHQILVDEKKNWGYEGSSTVCPRCQHNASFKGNRSRDIVTVCGRVRITRSYYHCVCGNGYCPADLQFGFEGRYSPGVQPLIGLAGILEAFNKAEDMLERLAGLKITDQTIRELVEEKGQQLIDQHQENQPVPLETTFDAPNWELLDENKKPTGQTVAYMGLDAFRVPILKDGKREGKMLYVGLIYTPNKRHKIYLSDFDHQQLAENMRLYATELNLGLLDQIVAITDGGNGLEEALTSSFGGKVTFVLDFWHASERVHEVAGLIFGDGDQGKVWADQAITQMRQCGGSGLLLWLDEQSESFGELPQEATKQWELLQGYIEKNVHRMDYPSYRARGWDIGSGPIEATCKAFKGRLGVTGAKWELDNCARVAALRGLYLSSHDMWDNFWQPSI